MLFYPLFPELCSSVCISVTLKSPLQGSESESQTRIQEQESEAKNRRLQMARQHVCFLITPFCVSELRGVPFLIEEKYFFLL